MSDGSGGLGFPQIYLTDRAIINLYILSAGAVFVMAAYFIGMYLIPLDTYSTAKSTKPNL